MKPLLAHIYEPHRVTYPCYVQPKLNGIRALYQTIDHKGYFQSRDGVPFTDGLLDHLTKPLAKLFGPEVILDGELYVHGWPLQRINGAVTPVRLEGNEDTKLVEYHVFDVVNLQERFFIRQQLRQRQPPIYCLETYIADDEDIANKYYADFVARGYEGLIYRLGNCPYTLPKQQFWNGQSPIGRTKFYSDKDNRVWHMLKRKDWNDDEFEFLSIRPTTGDKGNPGFILTVKSKYSTKPTFDLGSGLSNSEVNHYLEHPPIGKLVKVKYLVLSSDGIPLNGTILAIL